MTPAEEEEEEEDVVTDRRCNVDVWVGGVVWFFLVWVVVNSGDPGGVTVIIPNTC